MAPDSIGNFSRRGDKPHYVENWLRENSTSDCQQRFQITGQLKRNIIEVEYVKQRVTRSLEVLIYPMLEFHIKALGSI